MVDVIIVFFFFCVCVCLLESTFFVGKSPFSWVNPLFLRPFSIISKLWISQSIPSNPMKPAFSYSFSYGLPIRLSNSSSLDPPTHPGSWSRCRSSGWRPSATAPAPRAAAARRPGRWLRWCRGAVNFRWNSPNHLLGAKCGYPSGSKHQGVGEKQQCLICGFHWQLSFSWGDMEK